LIWILFYTIDICQSILSEWHRNSHSVSYSSSHYSYFIRIRNIDISLNDIAFIIEYIEHRHYLVTHLFSQLIILGHSFTFIFTLIFYYSHFTLLHYWWYWYRHYAGHYCITSLYIIYYWHFIILTLFNTLLLRHTPQITLSHCHIAITLPLHYFIDIDIIIDITSIDIDYAITLQIIDIDYDLLTATFHFSLTLLIAFHIDITCHHTEYTDTYYWDIYTELHTDTLQPLHYYSHLLILSTWYFQK